MNLFKIILQSYKMIYNKTVNTVLLFIFKHFFPKKTKISCSLLTFFGLYK